MRHDWQPVQDGVLTVRQRYACTRCGTRTEYSPTHSFEPIKTADEVARGADVWEDCQEQLVRNVLEA